VQVRITDNFGYSKREAIEAISTAIGILLGKDECDSQGWK
jgi:hypothetical protein